MSHLAKALQKYYTRENGKIAFTNKQSLNQLAFALWEMLGYQKIDASVLSRVLKGERLFTFDQLHAFCEILKIQSEEKALLSEELQKDYVTKKGGTVQDFLSSAINDKLAMIENLVKETFFLLFTGKGAHLGHLLSLTDDYIQQLYTASLLDMQADKLQELHGLQLYLTGRYKACIGLPSTVIPEMSKVTQQIMAINKTVKDSKLEAYANVLLSDAYYIAGGYTADENKRAFYSQAIQYGKRAWSLLEDSNPFKLLALRDIAASTIYLGDELMFSALQKTANEILERQPSNTANHVYALQLCGTLDRGSAYFKFPVQLAMREKGRRHFGKGLNGFSSFEVSDIREMIETLSLLKSKDKAYMKSLATKGFILAEESNAVRYINYFNKVLI
ncbi:hypothetical protein KSF_084210 [Reticulibacter mediterranei]|uniref:Uncharacterized protein n=1 Tax=Reticulibacter mediterranei TaxID=2778369 RepID=A0A8J3IQI2_9CHLR|nr:hypothetical protein [Reticulibacter mediterranei]GHO98373.1 hypothetical protein KSF_084210 [Reticulibacter mediterranei]